MRILYAVRVSRFGLLKATNALACRFTKWVSQCDVCLKRLVSYIWSSLDERLVGYVAEGDNNWSAPLDRC
eukprot:11227837-Lingulodinium_polyedra.AAC.1